MATVVPKNRKCTLRQQLFDFAKIKTLTADGDWPTIAPQLA
jgi:hypothetical protein